MRKLKVDMPELMQAMDSSEIELHFHLDASTGEVVMVMDDAYRMVGDYLSDRESPDDQALFEAWAKEEACAEWMVEELRVAYRILTDGSERYVEVPKADSREGYGDMEEFIETVQDERLQNKLWRAIEGKGAFRRFKDVLFYHPAERERWFKFKDECLKRRALEWLESLDIEVDEERPPN